MDGNHIPRRCEEVEACILEWEALAGGGTGKQVLAEQQACGCGDLVELELVPLAQSTVSEHLKVLKAAGLIQGTVDGPSTVDRIAPSTGFAQKVGFVPNLGIPSAT